MKYLARILIGVVVATSGISSSFAAPNFAINPMDAFNSLKPASNAKGIAFIENMASVFPMGYVAYSPQFYVSADQDWKLCSSWKDSNCIKRNGYTTNGFLLLGNCLSNSEIGCVKNLKITSAQGASETLKYKGPAFSKVQDIPEDSELGIPRSSSPPVYEDSGGNLYIVRANLRVNISPQIPKPDIAFELDVNPVMKISDPTITTPEVKSAESNFNHKGTIIVPPTHEECVSIDTGFCYKALNMNLDDEISVKVRVPSTLSGWLRGRVVNPKFETMALSSKSQEITISAKPAKLPIFGGWVSDSRITPAFLAEAFPGGDYFLDSRPSSHVVSPSIGAQGIKEFNLWNPYLNDRALTTITNWSFGAANAQSQNECLNRTSEITGFVTSNASVYSSNPPQWNPQDSTLTYQVASPHNDENGIPNLGTYTLAMPLSTIKCLYGQSNLPPSASVSIGYGSESVEIATVTLKSDSGWVYFNASGFHYSTPQIQVKFAKRTLSASSSFATTIWCAKGNAKKKVTAVKPSCPKGYKQIKDPTKG